ncbi:hypothetical protein AX16_003718 [Volvariella volvacea WC 439]|nr:hypothetical protein AX16_003718 [Volvariella volvacea WC 439]
MGSIVSLLRSVVPLVDGSFPQHDPHPSPPPSPRPALAPLPATRPVPHSVPPSVPLPDHHRPPPDAHDDDNDQFLDPEDPDHTKPLPSDAPSQSYPRPNHIPIPPLPTFGTWSLTPSPSHRFSDPFAEPVPSPALHFYTAPSSPQVDPPQTSPPVSPPLTTLSQEHRAQSPSEDDPLATSDIDLEMDDQTLTALEKIYLYSQSKSSFHRVYIARSLPEYLDLITPEEAIGYVLPLVRNLAIDPDEQVKLALAAELATIVWWFYSRCHLVSESPDSPEESTNAATDSVSVAAFTPILGTFLLNPDSMLGGAARYAVVKLLSRMKKADELGLPTREPSPPPAVRYDELEQEDARDFFIGYFGPSERAMLREEIIHQVVIGMGRLDDEDDDGGSVTLASHGQPETGATALNGDSTIRSEDQRDSINPYFPIYPPAPPNSDSPDSSQSSTPSPTSDVSTSSSETLASAHSPNLAVNTPTVLSWCKPSECSPTLALNTTLPHGSPRPRGRQLSPPPDVTTIHGRNPSPDGIDPPLCMPDYQPEIAWSGLRGERVEERDLDEEVEQAAVGKYSSMSLMAAVTASGTLEEDVKEAFVKEVQRVSKDPVTWVRQEAAYALGALAKVVPEELVQYSLLPVFASLRADSYSDVRHSALFALPAVLSRLTSSQRRTLALETIVPLSIDESHNVRNGVLEALGEVLYAFHEDFEGPPRELLQLFLGRKQDQDVRNGEHEAQAPKNSHIIISDTGNGLQISTVKSPELQEITTTDPTELLELFYINPERPHIIAFNFPAVAMAVGASRWHELREAYHDLAANRSLKVRKTIAASLGELARIIGPTNASRDLVAVWWDSVCCSDPDVRKKAVDCLDLFINNLEAGQSLRGLQSVNDLWQKGVFEAWRERESVTKALTSFMNEDYLVPVTVELFCKALDDAVAAVREAAVSALPLIWTTLASRHPSVLMELRDHLQTFGSASAHRGRMTFVSCQQILTDTRTLSITTDGIFWDSIRRLASDPVIGVRIGIARLVATMAGQMRHEEKEFPGSFTSLLQLLTSDDAHQVRAYVAEFAPWASTDTEAVVEAMGEEGSESELTPTPRPHRPPLRRVQNPAIFSRPPTLNTSYQTHRPAL